jgi:predicted kinase
MPTLHVIAGKAGSGKTTLARQLAAQLPAVVLCEDEWMSRLADPIANLRQYLDASARIRSVMAPLTVDVLGLGLSVVFDFAGNRPADRLWTRSIAERAGAALVVHYIQADDVTCRARVVQRNVQQPEGIFFGVVTPEQVNEVNRYFVPPGDDEGLTVILHAARSAADQA